MATKTKNQVLEEMGILKGEYRYLQEKGKWPNPETDAYIKYNAKGEILETRGTPFQIQQILRLKKEEEEAIKNLTPETKEALKLAGELLSKKSSDIKELRRRSYHYKPDTDMGKVSKTRRRRGYDFERWLVNDLIKRHYSVRRLGGATTKMPDVVATSHIVGQPKVMDPTQDFIVRSNMIAFECKSRVNVNKIWVPYDEVVRCENIKEMFSAYKKKAVVLAFKFAFMQINNPNKENKRRTVYRFVEIQGFDSEHEDFITEIGFNLSKDQLEIKWNKEAIKNVGEGCRGEDYDWTIYESLEDLLNHLGKFYTPNTELEAARRG